MYSNLLYGLRNKEVSRYRDVKILAKNGYQPLLDRDVNDYGKIENMRS